MLCGEIMKAKYQVVAIVSDTAPNANAYGIGRKVQVTANTKAHAIKLANAFYFIMAGHNERFSPFQLSDFKSYVPRLCKSSACRNYHVEVWCDGVTFDDIPGSSEDRRKKEKGAAQ